MGCCQSWILNSVGLLRWHPHECDSQLPATVDHPLSLFSIYGAVDALQHGLLEPSTSILQQMLSTPCSRRAPRLMAIPDELSMHAVVGGGDQGWQWPNWLFSWGGSSAAITIRCNFATCLFQLRLCVSLLPLALALALCSKSRAAVTPSAAPLSGTPPGGVGAGNFEGARFQPAQGRSFFFQ